MILLPWAPSANAMWRSGRRCYLSQQYKTFLTDARAYYLQQGAPRISGRVAVTVYLFPPNYRTYDVDNRIKPTLDALTKCGFWDDDKQVRRVTAIEGAPVANGAIVVKVEPYEQADVTALCKRFNLKPLGKKHV